MKIINRSNLLLLYLLLINEWNLVNSEEETDKNNSEVKNNKRNPIELDIRKRTCTNEFYYHEDKKRDFGFYVTKDNYIFQGIKRSGSFLSGVWFKQHIWTSKDEEEDTNIVIVNGITKNKLTVTILHKNGKAKEYYKSGFFNKFVEKKLNIVNNVNKNIKIIIDNENETDKNNENGNNLFKNSNGSPLLNIIKDGVKCVEIKYNNVTAWKYDASNANKEYPRALYYLPNKFVLFFNEYFQIYNYVGDSCELLYTNKIIPFMISMDDKETSSRYEYYNNGYGTTVFIAKEGYAFNEVKFLRSWVHKIRLDRNIWKVKNISHYANKVVIKKNGLFKKNLGIYLITGEKLIYHRSAWGLRWKMEGESKYIIRTLLTEKSEFPPEVKIITKFDNDSNVNVFKENDNTKFNLYKYHSDDGKFFYIYEFKNGTECVSFKYNQMYIWNHNERSKVGYPKKITYVPRKFNKMFKIEFSDELYYIYRCNGRILDLILSNSLKKNN